jgi:replicative DNA helicase
MKIKGKALIEIEDKLVDYQGPDRIVSSHQLAEELKDTDDSIFQLKTGIDKMDHLLGGVEAGEMIIVTGPTGEGKTTLLMSITKNMVEAGIKSVWFTLEVTPRQFLKKIISATPLGKELPMFYVPRRGIDNVDEEFQKWWEKSHHKPFEMIDWIEAKIIEAVTKDNVQVVFIDHIHMIFSLEKMGNRSLSLEIGDLVSKVKQIALDHNLVIFLIAHNKDAPEGTAREPRKEDIRDSGLISRLADTIVGVWRIPNDDDGDSSRRKPIEESDIKAKVRVFKNRREGKIGSFVMYHDSHYLSEDPFAGEKF